MQHVVRRTVRAVGVTGLVVFGALGAAGPMGPMGPTGPVAAAARTVSPVPGVAPGAGPGAAPSPSASAPSGGPQVAFDGPFGHIEVGGQLWVGLEGMSEGWQRAEVSSPALAEPVPFVPEPGGSPGTGRVADDTHQYLIRADIAPGTYPLTVTSGGRTVATAQLTVVARGAADVSRFVFGPEDSFPGGDESAAVRPGGAALVVLTDYSAADGEDSLKVTSPAFGGPVTLRRDSGLDPDCKCDDGGTVYTGRVRVRGGAAAGTYPMTAVSHHGQLTLTRQITVAGDPVSSRSPWLIGGVGAAVLLALGAGLRMVVARRRGKGADPAA
ncbi:hypothetical protein [Streptomyces sp. G-G2]|uniref:hypothetical protein n=1 Tax=Streptomyces sp. G-G2 TaxID=3046201 RepID=UPI0024BB981C|nr:hypothetical protein [Streptomyces sp. G-G2]MDJ0383687.1 hypothetical protein [Streptomyces sp. G-G2]